MASLISPAQDILKVENLSVAYGPRTVVDNVSFSLQRGKSLALIGESGSGKSTIAKSILRLLPRNAHNLDGQVWFEGQDFLRHSAKSLRDLRGRMIGFVPQDPQNAFNPVRSIGSQAHEAAKLLGLAHAQARKLSILEVFDRVGLRDPERVYESYPHQLSGGMLQRVLIGLTVMPKPDLIVADEPTSALDVTIQKRILDLLTSLQQTLNISLLLITHDLAIAAERTDNVVVLKHGRIQESGTAQTIFTNPQSDYTRRLLADVPTLNPTRYKTTRTTLPPADSHDALQIDVRNVSKTFTVDEREVHAVNNVSFQVQKGRTHALVGESGSGKTTLVRLLLGLEACDAGTIGIAGQHVNPGSTQAIRTIRRNLQLVYQNPFTSLDPTWRIEDIIREPLDRYQTESTHEQHARVLAAIKAVGLDDELLRRRPTELSGGQRQRVAIARALILRPDVLVLDEPTSALDVSVQADLVEVLFKLQAEYGLTYLFVSHDLSLVRQIADTVTVLQHGNVVEDGTVAQIFNAPGHAYTKLLIDSIPRPSVGLRAVRDPIYTAHAA